MREIADSKKKENIAEYLLYMWQVEDTLRAVRLHSEELKGTLFKSLEGSELESTLEWYAAVAAEMKQEGLAEKGHLSELDEVITELTFLQNMLLSQFKDQAFEKLYGEAQPLLEELQLKSGEKPPGEIERALNALYGILLLRLKGEKISPETQRAGEVLGKYLGHLAARYKQFKSGKLPSVFNN